MEFLILDIFIAQFWLILWLDLIGLVEKKLDLQLELMKILKKQLLLLMKKV